MLCTFVTKVQPCFGSFLEEAKLLQLLLAKVDVDSAAELAMQYQVEAIPTIIAFKDGEVVERMEGDHGDDQLDQLIDGLLR